MKKYKLYKKENKYKVTSSEGVTYTVDTPDEFFENKREENYTFVIVDFEYNLMLR